MKLLKVSRTDNYGCKWLVMAGTAKNRLDLAGMAGHGWEFMVIAKWLIVARRAGNGWKS